MKALLSILIFGSLILTCDFACAAEDDPETVLTKFQVKRGRTDDLLRLLDRAWATYQRLGLVRDEPHLVMRGKEDDGSEFVAEILPWKTHAAPDHAPPEVHVIWDAMQNLCEKRGDHKGIEFPEVEVVRNDS
jgi:hypothetical protein